MLFGPGDCRYISQSQRDNQAENEELAAEFKV